MAVYYKSNYARNKNRNSIFYHFNTGETREVTLEYYLKKEPDKTYKDFELLKFESDKDYHEEMLQDNKEIKHTTQLDEVELNNLVDNKATPLDYLCNKFSDKEFKENFESFLKSGYVTETEIRRFTMSYYDELTCIQIAQKEKTCERVIYTSITNFKNKAKNFLKMGSKML